MKTYYRVVDRAILELDEVEVSRLAASKRSTLYPFSVDQKPTPSATQYVEHGPIVVGKDAARQTWVLVGKTPDMLKAEAFAAERDVDLAQVKSIFQALKAGTGTAGERLTRCERVLARLLKDMFGGDPA